VELTVDHIISIENGGTNDEKNLICACSKCNDGKRARRIAHSPLDMPVDKETLWKDIPKDVCDSVKGKTGDALKAFFFSESLTPFKPILFDIFKDDDCIGDCARCMDIGNSAEYYTECAALLAAHGSEGVTAVESVTNPIHAKDLLRCDNCYLAGRCPKHRVGGLCQFDFTIDTDFTDATTAWRILINVQRERVMRGILFEKVDGGVPDKNVTSEMQLLISMIGEYENRGTPTVKLSMEGKGQGTSVISNLLSGIFGGGQRPAIPPAEQKQLPAPVESVATVVDAPKKRAKKRA
jgi:hypothetical protein